MKNTKPARVVLFCPTLRIELMFKGYSSYAAGRRESTKERKRRGIRPAEPTGFGARQPTLARFLWFVSDHKDTGEEWMVGRVYFNYNAPRQEYMGSVSHECQHFAEACVKERRKLLQKQKFAEEARAYIVGGLLQEFYVWSHHFKFDTDRFVASAGPSCEIWPGELWRLEE